MDDLTQIKGIGKATAKKLAAAGIGTIAALAALDASDLPAIDGITPEELANWAGAAKTPSVLQPAPAQIGDVVRITGPRQTRRRAGRVFGRDPVDIPLGELSEDELAMIEADPLLSVQHIEASAG